MKSTIKLNIGGELSAGDVVGVAYNNCIVFGWFVEPGQYGSLKFIRFGSADYILGRYEAFKNGTDISPRQQKEFEKGLLFKHFHRDYIISFGPVDNRAFKISNPEEFFKGSKQEVDYIRGKQALNSIKFPAK